MRRPDPKLLKVYRALDEAVLSAPEEGALSEGDDALKRHDGRTTLAFGRYSRKGIEHALRSYGLIAALEERGLKKTQVRLLLEDPFRPRITVFSPQHDAAVVDVELARCDGRRVFFGPPFADTPLLFLESIALQHPGRSFDWLRPKLPGQSHPGLSLLREILDVLALMAVRLGAEGLALIPSSLHAAWVYERSFSFVDPAAQGEFRALRSAAHLRPLWALAWAVELGCVRTADGVYRFEPKPMVCAISDPLWSYFSSDAYRGARDQAAQASFTIDWLSLGQKLPWDQMPGGKVPERIQRLLRPRDKPDGL